MTPPNGAAPLLFDDLPADPPRPRDGYAQAPTGRRRNPPPHRHRVRRPRPSTAALLARLADQLDRQHRETIAALDRLARRDRAERETLAGLLRQVTELRRGLGQTGLDKPERHTRRRPIGVE